MTNHLNTFLHYEKRPHHHEDHLTRAFLVVLRGVPLAHSAWLGLVDAAHRRTGGAGVPRLQELPPAEILTQVGSVPQGTKKVLSLVQTDEEYIVAEPAKGTDRRQVLDGVVSYGDLAIVIENKPSKGDVWNEQLVVNVADDVEHDPQVACVTWKDIVVAWGGLLDAGHLGPAETVLLGDFLDYIEECFPRLRPYSKLHLCGQDFGRIHRRCKGALEALFPSHVEKLRGWGWFIKLPDGGVATHIALIPWRDEEETCVVLEIALGDTMSQARTLYQTVEFSSVERLWSSPRKTGRWVAHPGFHVMHVTRGLFRPKATPLKLEDYWKLWADRPDLIRRYQRTEFGATFKLFLDLKLCEESDRETWDREIAGTRRQNFYLAPGVGIQWRIPLDEAGLLDQHGKLEREVFGAVREVASVFSLRLPEPEGR